MWLLPLQGALSPPCPALGILWLSTHPSLSCAPRHSPRLTARLLACHQNCLREIRSSLEQSKPIVLVQEADPAKGGTLQEHVPVVDDDGISLLRFANQLKKEKHCLVKKY